MERTESSQLHKHDRELYFESEKKFRALKSKLVEGTIQLNEEDKASLQAAHDIYKQTPFISRQYEDGRGFRARGTLLNLLDNMLGNYGFSIGEYNVTDYNFDSGLMKYRLF